MAEINPQIPLSVRPIDFPSPVQTIGSLMQMRRQVAEVAYRQAQAEQARQNALDIKAQADQRNRDLADQNTIQEMLKDPTAAPLLAKGDTSPLNGKISPANQQKYAEGQIGIIKNQATADTTTLENRSKALDLLTKGLGSFRVNPDLDTTNSQLPGFIQQHIKDGTFQMAGIDPSQLQQQFSSLDQLDHAEAGLGLLKGVADAALAMKKEQAGITETTAKGNEAQANSDLATFKLNAAKQAMNGAGAVSDPESAVATLIDPKDPAYAHALAAGKLAMQGADPTVIGSRAKAFNEAVEKVYQEEVQGPKVAAAKANAELPAQINRAVAVAKATAPIEQARALTVANTNRANSGAEKLDAEYNQARTAAESIGRVLDLASSGNKAAGSNLPVLGVGAMNAINSIRRMNSAEINQYGNAGSLLDKIKGKIGGLVEGKPIPQDVLDDMRELHEELATEAYNKYTTGLKSLEQRTPGVKLPPTIPPPNIRQAGSGSSGKFNVTDPTGKIHPFDTQAQADAFKKLAHIQ